MGEDIISHCPFNVHVSDTCKVEPLLIWLLAVQVSSSVRHLSTTYAELSTASFVFLLDLRKFFVQTKCLLVVCTAFAFSSQIVRFYWAAHLGCAFFIMHIIIHKKILFKNHSLSWGHKNVLLDFLLNVLKFCYSHVSLEPTWRRVCGGRWGSNFTFSIWISTCLSSVYKSVFSPRVGDDSPS